MVGMDGNGWASMQEYTYTTYVQLHTYTPIHPIHLYTLSWAISVCNCVSVDVCDAMSVCRAFSSASRAFFSASMSSSCLLLLNVCVECVHRMCVFIVNVKHHIHSALISIAGCPPKPHHYTLFKQCGHVPASSSQAANVLCHGCQLDLGVITLFKAQFVAQAVGNGPASLFGNCIPCLFCCWCARLLGVICAYRVAVWSSVFTAHITLHTPQQQ